MWYFLSFKKERQGCTYHLTGCLGNKTLPEGYQYNEDINDICDRGQCCSPCLTPLTHCGMYLYPFYVKKLFGDDTLCQTGKGIKGSWEFFRKADCSIFYHYLQGWFASAEIQDLRATSSHP